MEYPKPSRRSTSVISSLGYRCSPSQASGSEEHSFTRPLTAGPDSSPSTDLSPAARNLRRTFPRSTRHMNEKNSREGGEKNFFFHSLVPNLFCGLNTTYRSFVRGGMEPIPPHRCRPPERQSRSQKPLPRRPCSSPPYASMAFPCSRVAPCPTIPRGIARVIGRGGGRPVEAYSRIDSRSVIRR